MHQTWPGCGQCGGWRRVNWHSSAAQHTPHYCSTRAGDDFSNFSQFLEKFIDLFKVPTSAFALKNLLHYTKRIFKHSKSFVIFLSDYWLLIAELLYMNSPYCGNFCKISSTALCSSQLGKGLLLLPLGYAAPDHNRQKGNRL